MWGTGTGTGMDMGTGIAPSRPVRLARPGRVSVRTGMGMTTMTCRRFLRLRSVGGRALFIWAMGMWSGGIIISLQSRVITLQVPVRAGCHLPADPDRDWRSTRLVYPRGLSRIRPCIAGHHIPISPLPRHNDASPCPACRLFSTVSPG